MEKKNGKGESRCSVGLRAVIYNGSEVYKCKNKQDAPFKWDMFHDKSNQYDVRSKSQLMLLQTNTIR